MSHTHTFKVKMTCGGCSGAVERALKRHSEVSNIEIDMEKQLVHVTTTLDQDTVFGIISKTGKATEKA